MREGLNHFNDEVKGYSRINMNTPAVTRVDECTRADTGVGAAIASGSHALKGSWALLVMLANRRRSAVREGNLVESCHMDRIFQWPWDIIDTIAVMISASPIRLVITVMNPLFRAVWDW